MTASTRNAWSARSIARRATLLMSARGQAIVRRRISFALVRHQGLRAAQPFLDTRWRSAASALFRPPAWDGRMQTPVPGRIMLCVSSLSGGGAERQMLYTAQGLKARGRDVHLVAEYLHDEPGNAFYLPQAADSLQSVEELAIEDRLGDPWIAAHPEFARLFDSLVLNRILNAAHCIARIAPEIVQASLDWTNVTFGLGALLAGVPRIVLSGRNLAPTRFGFFDWFLYPSYRLLALQSQVRLTNNSSAGAADYARWLRISADSIAVIRNGIDLKRFAPPSPEERARARAALGISENEKVVAGAFRMSPEKRPLLWVETAAALQRASPRTRFLLFGDGPMLQSVLSRAAALGLGEGFRYGGLAADLRAAFAPADLVMLTSLHEGTPNVLIEAQAMGLPVLTTPAFGAAEAVDDGATGRVVHGETPQKIAEAGAALLRDDGFRAHARTHGPRWAEARFGMRRMIDETLATHSGAPFA